MTISIKCILSSIALAGLAVLPTLQAESVRGRFHLSVPVYLGESLLRPGDYNIALLQSGLGLKQVAVVGNGGRAYALPLVVEKPLTNGASSLQLVEVGGNYFVKEFRSQETRKIYSFLLPKKLPAQASKAVEITD